MCKHRNICDYSDNRLRFTKTRRADSFPEMIVGTRVVRFACLFSRKFKIKIKKHLLLYKGVKFSQFEIDSKLKLLSLVWDTVLFGTYAQGFSSTCHIRASILYKTGLCFQSHRQEHHKCHVNCRWTCTQRRLSDIKACF